MDHLVPTYEYPPIKDAKQLCLFSIEAPQAV